jgi:protein phosphatase
VDAGSVMAALHEANRDIFSRAGTFAADGMGTTVVGIALSRDDAAADSLLLFNVGDSRAYRLRGGELIQLSEDHSLVAELVLRGDLTADQAETDNRRNVVTRALGIEENVEIDEWFVEPVVGDRYLMCSDGLTGEVADAEIAEVLRAVALPGDAASALVELALLAGGRDNVSAVVVDIEGVGQADAAIDADTDRREDPDES